MNLFNLLVIAFLVMLAILGHGVWHHGMVEVANFIVHLFTGATVTG